MFSKNTFTGLKKMVFKLLLKKKKFRIITTNPPGVWPVFTLPTRGLKLYTLPT